MQPDETAMPNPENDLAKAIKNALDTIDKEPTGTVREQTIRKGLTALHVVAQDVWKGDERGQDDQALIRGRMEAGRILSETAQSVFLHFDA